MSIRPLSFQSLTPTPLAARACDAEDIDFATLCPANSSFSDFLSSLPELGLTRDLFAVRDAMVNAYKQQRGVVLACGGKVVSAGLSPLIVRAIEQRRITALALTGDALLQDVEVALSGHTVLRQQNLTDAGMFDVSAEAGKLINHAIHLGAQENQGIGAATALALLDSEAAFVQYSMIAAAQRAGIPVTVHPALGMDAFAIHPTSHGESLGATGMIDFKLLAAVLGRKNPAVILNAGSSMVLPRVLVQAVDLARQVATPLADVTAVMLASCVDRQAINSMLARLANDASDRYILSGAEELLLPLLFAAVQDALGDT